MTSPDELSILHWNVHSWRDEAGRPNHDAVLRLIGQTSPDMVSLVEVSEPWGSPAALRDLARAGGYTWIFFPAMEFGRDAPDRGYGNALLTRVPVLAAAQWRLTWPPRLYDGTEPSESRSVILAEVPFGRGTAWIGSTHLPASDPAAPIDYCVASPGVSVAARILTAAGSDHLPLLARLVTSAG